MATPYEIPLQPKAASFSISLAGTVYRITIRPNQYGGFWYMDLNDIFGNRLVSGVPLVTGTDLFGQFPYLKLGGQFIVQTDYDPLAPPDYNTLGINSHLYFVVP